jgi:hypothetical protein
VKRLLAFLRRSRARPTPRPIDPERLHRIYRETHRQVEELRRAA